MRSMVFSRSIFPALLLGAVACGGDSGIKDTAGSDGAGDGSGDGSGDDGGGDGGGDDGGGDDGGGGGREAGDTIDEATPTTREADGSISVDERIGEPGDRDFFAIDVTQGEILWVFSLAYYLTEVATPDTVVRLYDPSGNLVAENDDMPFRLAETDSAVYFQATEDGTWYVEVLEWSDWSPLSEGPLGGSEFEYTLAVFPTTELDPEPDNNTVEGVLAYLEGEEAYVYVGDPLGTGQPLMQADMDDASDVDLYVLDVEESADYDDLYYAASFWPGALGALSPEVRVFDADGNTLSWTDSPTYSVDRSNFYNGLGFLYGADHGTFAHLEPGTYFIEVKDSAGASGVGTYYTGVIGGYYTTSAPWEGGDRDNDVVVVGPSLEMTEFSSGGGFYGGAGGRIEDSETLDAWRIAGSDVGGLDGKYLTLHVSSEAIGYGLDARVTVYDSGGTVVLAEATTNDFDSGADPSIVDLELGDDSSVIVVVTAEDQDPIETVNNYILSAYVTDEPTM
jgi:hypothetical protein